MDRPGGSKRVRFAASSGQHQQGSDADDSGGHISPHHQHVDAEAESSDGLEADISSGRRRRHRRRVNTDGYGSDASEQDEAGNLSDFSSDDQDGDNNEAASRQGKRTDSDGDDDMFSPEEEGVNAAASANGKTQAKRKRFMDIGDIEGQEMDSVSRTERTGSRLVAAAAAALADRKGKQPEWADSDGEDDSEDGGGGDDGEGGRIKIEAFNMRDDLEEGRFDAQGTFVWHKKDPQAHQDAWLDGVTKGAMSRARASKARQEEQAPAGALRWDGVPNDDIVLAIINILRPRETVLAALARIGGPKSTAAKNRWSRHRRANARKNKGKDAPAPSEDLAREAERRAAIERLTELADQAMARGMSAVYDDTYEQLVRHMRRAGRIPDTWEPGTPLPTAADRNVMDANDGSGGLLDDLL